MLSRADVAKTVVVMKRFWPYIEADDVAVGAWLDLFNREGLDADTLRDAVMNAVAAGASDEREVGARILQEARALRGVVDDPHAHLHDYSLDVIADDKRRQLEAAGVTEAEYEARKHDPAWIAATFPQKAIAAGPDREEWLE